jgi:hypothetical protein
MPEHGLEQYLAVPISLFPRSNGTSFGCHESLVYSQRNAMEGNASRVRQKMDQTLTRDRNQRIVTRMTSLLL